MKAIIFSDQLLSNRANPTAPAKVLGLITNEDQANALVDGINAALNLGTVLMGSGTDFAAGDLVQVQPVDVVGTVVVGDNIQRVSSEWATTP